MDRCAEVAIVISVFMRRIHASIHTGHLSSGCGADLIKIPFRMGPGDIELDLYLWYDQIEEQSSAGVNSSIGCGAP
jgi:hypothetical protein